MVLHGTFSLPKIWFHYRGGFCNCQINFSKNIFELWVVCVLYAQHITHCLGGFFLRSGGHMGVGIQGESCREVAQYAGYGLDIHAVLEG